MYKQFSTFFSIYWKSIQNCIPNPGATESSKKYSKNIFCVSLVSSVFKFLIFSDFDFFRTNFHQVFKFVSSILENVYLLFCMIKIDKNIFDIWFRISFKTPFNSNSISFYSYNKYIYSFSIPFDFLILSNRLFIEQWCSNPKSVTAQSLESWTSQLNVEGNEWMRAVKWPNILLPFQCPSFTLGELYMYWNGNNTFDSSLPSISFVTFYLQRAY